MINFENLIKAIHDSAISANQAIMDENLKLIDTYFEDHSGSIIDDEEEYGERNVKKQEVLKPKTIVIEFPEQTAKGVKMKRVNVPLIALVPVVASEISEIRFQTDLDIMIDNNDLKIGFPQKTSRSIFKKSPNPDKTYSSRLEIIINPKETSEGLKSLIKGFESVLRAQIPY